MKSSSVLRFVSTFFCSATISLLMLNCKVSGVSSHSVASSTNGPASGWQATDTSYFPYAGDCDPFKSFCAGGDFERDKVTKEYQINKSKAFPGDMLTKIPAWGPHTFHCVQYRAQDNVAFKDLYAPGQPDYFKYYVGVSSHIGAGCGDVIRLKLNGKEFRYLVTDICPTYHAVQGNQGHCNKPNLDVSRYGIMQQLGVPDNTTGKAQYMIECKGNCGHIKLGPVN